MSFGKIKERLETLKKMKEAEMSFE